MMPRLVASRPAPSTSAAAPAKPTKWTPKFESDLLDSIRKGIPQYLVLRRYGVNDGSLRERLKSGQAGRQPHAEFYARYQAARAEAIRERVLFELNHHGLVITVRRSRPYTRTRTSSE